MTKSSAEAAKDYVMFTFSNGPSSSSSPEPRWVVVHILSKTSSATQVITRAVAATAGEGVIAVLAKERQQQQHHL